MTFVSKEITKNSYIIERYCVIKVTSQPMKLENISTLLTHFDKCVDLERVVRNITPDVNIQSIDLDDRKLGANILKVGENINNNVKYELFVSLSEENIGNL